VKVGNAGGLDVQFNGKSLGILGVTGKVVEIQLPRVSKKQTVQTTVNLAPEKTVSPVQ